MKIYHSVSSYASLLFLDIDKDFEYLAMFRINSYPIFRDISPKNIGFPCIFLFLVMEFLLSLNVLNALNEHSVLKPTKEFAKLKLFYLVSEWLNSIVSSLKREAATSRFFICKRSPVSKQSIACPAQTCNYM